MKSHFYFSLLVTAMLAFVSNLFCNAQPGSVDWGIYMNSSNPVLSGDEFVEQMVTEQSGSNSIIYAVGISGSSSGSLAQSLRSALS